MIVWRISARLISRARLKPAEMSAQPRTTAGRVTKQIRPIAVCRPIRAKVLSPSPISWASDRLSGPRGMLQSHTMVSVPPIAADHQATTTQKVATAIGKCKMPCARSSQNWVWRSGVTIRFQAPSPSSDVR